MKLKNDKGLQTVQKSELCLSDRFSSQGRRSGLKSHTLSPIRATFIEKIEQIVSFSRDNQISHK